MLLELPRHILCPPPMGTGLLPGDILVDMGPGKPDHFAIVSNHVPQIEGINHRNEHMIHARFDVLNITNPYLKPDEVAHSHIYPSAWLVFRINAQKWPGLAQRALKIAFTWLGEPYQRGRYFESDQMLMPNMDIPKAFWTTEYHPEKGSGINYALKMATRAKKSARKTRMMPFQDPHSRKKFLTMKGTTCGRFILEIFQAAALEELIDLSHLNELGGYHVTTNKSILDEEDRRKFSYRGHLGTLQGDQPQEAPFMVVSVKDAWHSKYDTQYNASESINRIENFLPSAFQYDARILPEKHFFTALLTDTENIQLIGGFNVTPTPGVTSSMSMSPGPNFSPTSGRQSITATLYNLLTNIELNPTAIIGDSEAIINEVRRNIPPVTLITSPNAGKRQEPTPTDTIRPIRSPASPFSEDGEGASSTRSTPWPPESPHQGSPPRPVDTRPADTSLRERIRRMTLDRNLLGSPAPRNQRPPLSPRGRGKGPKK